MQQTIDDEVRAHHAGDVSANALGLEVATVDEGLVVLEWRPASSHANGAGFVHGGYLFLLADTAFAYCCLSLSRFSVTRTADIAYLKPGRADAVLRATAELRSLSGRTTICDVVVHDESGDVVAEFRGHGAMIAAPSATLHG